MPIHDFGFKKIEDVEKEVEDGKAQEIKSSISEPEELDIVETPPKKITKIKSKPPKKIVKTTPKIEKKPSSHPMVNGLLEIEEEEL